MNTSDFYLTRDFVSFANRRKKERGVYRFPVSVITFFSAVVRSSQPPLIAGLLLREFLRTSANAELALVGKNLLDKTLTEYGLTRPEREESQHSIMFKTSLLYQ